MRVIFVGLHNKPGKAPLCSSTKSGKLIDRIIDAVDPIALFCVDNGFVKTNLFDVEYYPTNTAENYGRATLWWSRVSVQAEDLVILLGAAVHRDFVNLPMHKNIVKVAHPASKRSHKDMDEYVRTVAEKIKTIQQQAEKPSHA